MTFSALADFLTLGGDDVSVLQQVPGPKKESRTGRRMSPWMAPKTMTSSTILKNVKKM